MRDSGTLDPFRETLQLIAEGVTEIAGFKESTIYLVVDDYFLEIVALAGNDEAREQLLGRREPVARIEQEMELSDMWGLLRFVPAERAPQELIDNPEPGMVPDMEVLDHPDAWQPLDLLFAPFHDADGVLRGMMSIDIPADGMRPGPAKRELLQKYAAQAGRAVLSSFERERISQQAALARATRDIVRRASAELSLTDVLKATERALVDGFSALGLWIQTYGDDPDERQEARIFSSEGEEIRLPDELVAIAEAAATHCWRMQEAIVIAPWRPRPEVLDPEQHRTVLDFIEAIAVHSMLFAPLGTGPDCLGSVVLTRVGGQRHDWTPVECAAMLDVGADLGRAIRNARDLDRERALIRELRALDGHKNQLVTALAQELGEPLGSLTTTLDELRDRIDLPAPVRRPLEPIARGAARMSRVVEDLGFLSQVGDPHRPLKPVAVDLMALVADAVDLVLIAARTKGLDVRVETRGEPGAPTTVWGEPDELDRVVVNLVSNAVKYTPSGGRVVIAVSAYARMVVLEVEDTGLGISEEDQERLFREFFRSTNPEALGQPGTGLGLTIVARIVERHRGTLDLESELGAGTTFRVGLPAPPPGHGEGDRILMAAHATAAG